MLCNTFPVNVLPAIAKENLPNEAQANSAAVVQTFVNPNIELEASDHNYLQDVAYKGGITEGSIFSENTTLDNFNYTLQSNINTDIAGKAKQLSYLKESFSKTKEKADEYIVAKSSDLIFASGVHFKIND